MGSYINFKKSNCKDCYKCIRNCPVKSIRFSSHQAQIIEDECILCGKCFVSCPQNAKEIRNDLSKVINAIKEGKECYASIAPSYVANYEGYSIKSLEKALLSLGFKGVSETALGATVVKSCYDEMVNLEKQDVIISTCCHTVNLLIEKHFKEAIPYMASIKSPMQAHCAQIKEDYPNAYTVFIGPCISKKAEAEAYPGDVDAVLTFEELSEWMDKEGISLENIPDDSFKGRTRLFPTTGGILKSMLCENKDYTYVAIDGVENCINAIKDILSGRVHKCFIEMSACVGSCINGPCIAKLHHNAVSDYIAINKSASNVDFDVNKKTYDELYQEKKPYFVHHIEPSEVEIQDILQKMNKNKKDNELNCGSCGYNTCREKAIAVYQGKADMTMCLPYLKEKAESFSDDIIYNTPNGVIVLNDNFEIQLINQAACNIVNVKHSKDLIGMPVVQILDPDDYIMVSSRKKSIINKRVYLSEYGRTIEESIIYNDKFHIMIGFLRDITESENQKNQKEEISRQTIEVTDNIIQKQMRVVQEIASLLGETTAETKVALTKLKESLKND